MKIKYAGMRGKRIITTCQNCSEQFETLSYKVKSKGEKFYSIICYKDYRNKNKQDRKMLNVFYQKKHKYGIDKSQYIKMLMLSNGKCSICKCSTNILCVDHDHNTNSVRGLICHSCNKLLGNAKDNINTLKNAIKYLVYYIKK